MIESTVHIKLSLHHFKFNSEVNFTKQNALVKLISRHLFSYLNVKQKLPFIMVKIGYELVKFYG